jgi:alpha-galactosidase
MRIPVLPIVISVICLQGAISLRPQDGPAGANHWTLDNGLVSREIVFDARDGLTTKSWKNLKDGKEFIDPEQETMDNYCRGFRFSVDDRAYTGTPRLFTVVSAQESTDSTNASHLDLNLASHDQAIYLTVHYTLPEGSTAVRQSVSIRNGTLRPITLSHLSVACESIAPAQPDNLLAYGAYGEEPRPIFFTGRTDDVAILLENAATGDGVAVLSEVPGVLKRTEVGVIGKWHQWEPGIDSMYDTDLFPFERTVAPQETFNSAAVSFLLYKRDTVQDPHWLIPQYVLKQIARPEREPRWMYNDWEPFETKIDANQLEEVERAVARTGIGMFVIDDGWEKMRANNAFNSKLFPEGVAPIAELAKQNGMDFGMWSPIAVASPDAPVVVNHPEWMCHDERGEVRHMAGMVQMDITSPFRDDELERLTELIRQDHLQYIKLDLTTVSNTYGEKIGCYGPGGEHGAVPSDHEFVARGYESLQYIADALHQRFPDLLIDYSFELWGGKHLIDYGLLRDADLDWISNVADRVSTDAGPRSARMLLYQRAMAIPAESMLIGNLQAETGSWRVRAATAMGSWPLLLGDFRKIPPQHQVHYANWIARYLTLRQEVNLNQSFFPLGAWRQPRINQWDGFARFSTQGEGIVILFANGPHSATAHVNIPGFPDGQYSARDWNSCRAYSLTGRDLRRGIDIPITEDAEVLELRQDPRSKSDRVHFQGCPD